MSNTWFPVTECINCGGEAESEYSLVIPTGVLLEDEPLCTTCHALFAGSKQFEIHAAPVLLRGGDPGDDDSESASEELKRSQS